MLPAGSQLTICPRSKVMTRQQTRIKTMTKQQTKIVFICAGIFIGSFILRSTVNSAMQAAYAARQAALKAQRQNGTRPVAVIPDRVTNAPPVQTVGPNRSPSLAPN